ncbi:atypical chemokine receptor 4 isoform X2 [Equus przewalskii]|uniref:Atypical chemokine receptor 4 isoform X2 n=1 Tax=Equus przewalskii TaxID=9798 RepID=A0ABM4KVD4_EQUPR
MLKRIKDEVKQKILKKCNRIIEWLAKNQITKKEQFNFSRKSWRQSETPALSQCTREQLTEPASFLLVAHMGILLHRLVNLSSENFMETILTQDSKLQVSDKLSNCKTELDKKLQNSNGETDDLIKLLTED